MDIKLTTRVFKAENASVVIGDDRRNDLHDQIKNVNQPSTGMVGAASLMFQGLSLSEKNTKELSQQQKPNATPSSSRMEDGAKKVVTEDESFTKKAFEIFKKITNNKNMVGPDVAPDNESPCFLMLKWLSKLDKSIDE